MFDKFQSKGSAPMDVVVESRGEMMMNLKEEKRESIPLADPELTV
jgi:hypothetical protein